MEMERESYSNLRDRKAIEVKGTFGSDYSGDTVTRANYEYLKEKYAGKPGFLDVYGDYSTYGIAYTGDASIEDIESLQEEMDRLESYPCLDDDRVSRIEMDAIEGLFNDEYDIGLKELMVDGEVPATVKDKAHEIVMHGIGELAYCETGCTPYISWSAVRDALARVPA